MQKHQLYINLFAITSALALGACADEENGVVTPEVPEVEIGEKTPIVLSSATNNGSGSFPLTRSAFVDGKGKVTAFEKDTRLHFLFVSENADDSTDKKYSETYGEAKGSGKSASQLGADPDQWAATEKESAIDFSSGKGIMRYWDDAHARKSNLSVYGFTNVFASNPTGAPWFPRLDRKTSSNDGSHETHQFPATWQVYDDAMGTYIGATAGKWTVGVYNGQDETNNYLYQSKTSILSKDDIAYSNNLSGTNCLKFDDTNKKFTTGVAEFHRAMSMFTINIVAGAGFDISADQFKFATDKNIAMNGWNKKGFLNIKTGVWSAIEPGNWSKIDNTNEDREGADKGKPYNDNGKYYYTLLAFVIPGNNISTEATDNAIQFTIDGNEYKVSKNMLYNAIKDNPVNCDGSTAGGTVKSDILTEGTTIKAGINYEFTFTVGKSKIQNITAQIIDWETVTADPQNFSNARVKLQLEERGSPLTSNVAVYSKTDNNTGDIDDNYAAYNWKSGYTNMEATYTSSHWTTNKYWHSNKEYYHFRALMPASTEVTAEATDGDYVTLTSKSAYTDVCWGAPMKDDGENETAGTFKWTYDPVSGFDNSDHSQIYKAIGATDNPIKLILFHMMSDLTFNIKTTTGADKVVLKDGENKASVKIVGLSPAGKVLLGNGRVIPNAKDPDDILSIPVDWNSDNSSDTHVYKYGAVPQDLEGVKLYITTLDNNQYIVDLASIVASAANLSSNSIANPYHELVEDGLSVVKYVINSWYPGFKYTYNLTLKKKGITDITATVVNWETVDTDDEEVTIQ